MPEVKNIEATRFDTHILFFPLWCNFYLLHKVASLLQSTV